MFIIGSKAHSDYLRGYRDGILFVYNVDPSANDVYSDESEDYQNGFIDAQFYGIMREGSNYDEICITTSG